MNITLTHQQQEFVETMQITIKEHTRRYGVSQLHNYAIDAWFAQFSDANEYAKMKNRLMRKNGLNDDYVVVRLNETNDTLSFAKNLA